jgi:hypothetical protein
MLFRRLCASLALLLVVLTSGCCRDGWCCRRPLLQRCQPACCPEPACGCCTMTGYPPIESVPPPPAHPGPALR